MNSWMLCTVLKTMPRTDANDFEDSKIILKPRKEWENDIFKYLSLFLISILSVWLTDKLPVPYAGTLFFFLGIAGFFISCICGFRAIVVYKYYDDLFKKADIDKLA